MIRPSLEQAFRPPSCTVSSSGLKIGVGAMFWDLIDKPIKKLLWTITDRLDKIRYMDYQILFLIILLTIPSSST